MNINENIKNFRTFRGIRQQDLADMLGRSKSVISNWERGENSPDLDSCEKLCKILRVTPNQLFGWEKNEEYEAHAKRLNDIKAQIADLQRTKEDIDKQISNLEVQMYQEQDPLLDIIDHEGRPIDE